MLDLTDDQLISLGLVVTLLVFSRAKDLLDISGILAATFTGLTVSLLGHLTWLVALFVFLVTGSLATKWKMEEKKALSLEEANEGLRGWRNVIANGGAVSLVAVYYTHLTLPTTPNVWISVCPVSVKKTTITWSKVIVD